MKNKKIWLSSPNMGGEEIKYIEDAFRTNWIAPLGPNVDQFENEMSEYLGSGYCAALSSGTAAIHLALVMTGVGPGDEVICQSFTFSGSANPIAYQYATPVFIDSEKDSWNMDPELLEEAIVDREKLTGKKPKAAIVVHLYGQSAKIVEIAEICKKHGVFLIEDAAEALGGSFKDKKLGTFGDIGILSFNGNKIITTSGGGMLFSKNESYVKRARFLATQARDDAPHYEHSTVGYNYRMSNILAGIGRGQLKVLDDRVKRKRDIRAKYNNTLGKIDGINFQQEIEGSIGNFWLSAVEIDPDRLPVEREDIRKKLLEFNIESRPLWKPMHLQPVFRKAPAYINGISENLFLKGLCLPSDTNMTDHDQEKIISVIKELLR